MSDAPALEKWNVAFGVATFVVSGANVPVGAGPAARGAALGADWTGAADGVTAGAAAAAACIAAESAAESTGAGGGGKSFGVISTTPIASAIARKKRLSISTQ
jgi:hypothetical protein